MESKPTPIPEQKAPQTVKTELRENYTKQEQHFPKILDHQVSNDGERALLLKQPKHPLQDAYYCFHQLEYALPFVLIT